MPLGLVNRSGSYTLHRRNSVARFCSPVRSAPGKSQFGTLGSFTAAKCRRKLKFLTPKSFATELLSQNYDGVDGSFTKQDNEQLIQAYTTFLKTLYTCLDNSPERRAKDSFVNSQEWTVSRAVPDLKLGVVGSLSSGKTALVHRYLTGSYMQDESPEGGRFKKEVVIDGQSYLLLIRDEGGTPDEQFAHWVDAVILVFSLENESSFNAVYQYYAKLAHFRNTADIPLILVGSQDSITDCHPRVVEETCARKMAHDLKRCAYFETCATYGLNVEKVFREACTKIIHQRLQSRSPVPPPAHSLPSTPNHPPYRTHHPPHNSNRAPSPGMNHFTGAQSGVSPVFAVPAVPGGSTVSPRGGGWGVSPSASNQSVSSMHSQSSSGLPNHHSTPLNFRDFDGGNRTPSVSVSRMSSSGDPRLAAQQSTENQLDPQSNGHQLPTPSSTPTTQRKNATRRISNIFKGSKEVEERGNLRECLGSGRSIPIKQGTMYKRSSKSLQKEWKKKFVCLMSDGRITYHSNLKDYMEDSHGKEIFLGLATVKIPGQRPKGAQRSHTQPITNVPLYPSNGLSKENSYSELSRLAKAKEKPESRGGIQLTGYEAIPEGRLSFGGYDNNALYPSGGENDREQGSSAKGETPNVKKKKHAKKGSTAKNGDFDESEDCEFVVLSSDQKQWLFEASSMEERDEWVTAIEEQISKSLQGQLSNKRESSRAHSHPSAVQALRAIPGNDQCCDCGTTNPDWASLNLGAVICIECSGIHRNLGSHISRVRSLDLDEWPVEYLSVMQALGNNVVNTLWEYDTKGRRKPGPDDNRETKEQWIRAKYESCQFLSPLPLPPTSKSLPRQLVDAVLGKELESLVLVLAHCQRDALVDEDRGGYENPVNCTLSIRDRRTPLHLACSVGSPEVTQLLIWHNADLRAMDQEGRSSLWYAKQGGSKSCVEILLNAGLQPDYGMPPASRGSSVGGLSGDGTGKLVNGSRKGPSVMVNGRTDLRASVGRTSESHTPISSKLPLPNGRSGGTTNPSEAFDKLPASVI